MQIVEKDGAVSFAVRLQPRASRDEISGEWQGGLKIRLTAPPVDDRANEALRRFLAASLKVPLSAVRIRFAHWRDESACVRTWFWSM